MDSPTHSRLAAPEPAPAWLQAAIEHVCYEALRGTSRRALLDQVCGEIARSLSMPLVVLMHSYEDGLIEIDATSSENLLWAELQRVPERADGTITGNGPAAQALRTGVTAEVAVTDEGFFPWRKAAQSEDIGGAIACPLSPGDRNRALVIFYPSTGPSCRDLTAIAKSLDELCRLVDRLERDRLLAAALSQAGNPAFIADVNGIISWTNASFCRLSGYSSHELIGRNPRVLSSGEHGASHYRGLWNTILAGKVWRGETVDRRRDGETFSAVQTISPIRVDRQSAHYLSLYEDVTRERDEQALRELCTGVDALTGLMYRAALDQKIEAHLDKGSGVSLLRLKARDMGHLGAYGEGAAANFCEELEQRLIHVLDPSRVARLKPGDYLAWLPEGVDASSKLMTKLRSELREPYPFFGELPAVDLRVGLAEGPRNGRTVVELLKFADSDLDRSDPLG